ncbi:E3 ubiquitin-protein ligase RSL1 [Cardamine amara subsp. amara]|uniref:E3 ubiquitin-protein ligase RSL1 n=1 Tax=Cardamine amara subsp. amara TaxID=228776 RepID=A0ABD0ZR04_CARAN
MEEKCSQDGENSSPDSGFYRLYFKGLIREETKGTLVAGFGVAICSQQDDILFQMKGSIHNSAITVLEAELLALKRGLTEAVSLGVTHISIYCDHYQIFELVKGRCAPEKDSLALLMNDVQRIRQQLTSSTPIMVTRDQTNKFAYKLALETLVSKIRFRCFNRCRINLAS